MRGTFRALCRAMCRLLAYAGPPVLVANIVLWPARSIIKQSYDAKERKEDATMHGHLSLGSLNGDRKA